jgi:Ala-tRNA(Pro) deacylase
MLRDMLERRSIPYRWIEHEPAFTSQDLAHTVHRSGHVVVKPVVVDAEGQLVMCAVPAPFKVDLVELASVLNVTTVRLANEQQMRRVFRECELGAEPPIGAMFDLPTVMDDDLGDKLYVTFQAGTHRDAVTISMHDFVELARPTVAHIVDEAATTEVR